jgi:CMP-N,N'-diacetyllegionaminic acid synthase
MKIIALVPARGGSKGIPDKNIRLLADKPLLQYTLEAAVQSSVFDQIIVSSDSEKILNLAKQFPVTAYRRPDILAQDSTPTNPVIEDVIEKFHLDDDDILVLLQPTSPLRKASEITLSLQAYQQAAEIKALISVMPVSNHYLYAYRCEQNQLIQINPEYHALGRRQELPDIYLPNGAIYIFSVKDFMQNKKIPDQSIMPYIMPAELSVDIDNMQDWQKAEEQLLQENAEHQL